MPPSWALSLRQYKRGSEKGALKFQIKENIIFYTMKEANKEGAGE